MTFIPDAWKKGGFILTKEQRIKELRYHKKIQIKYQICIAFLLLAVFIVSYIENQLLTGFSIIVILSILCTGYLQFKEKGVHQQLATDTQAGRLIGRLYMWTYTFRILPGILLFLMIFLKRPIFIIPILLMILVESIVRWYYEQKIRLVDSEHPKQAEI